MIIHEPSEINIRKFSGKIKDFNDPDFYLEGPIGAASIKKGYLDTINGIFSWFHTRKVDASAYKLKAKWNPDFQQDLGAYNSVEETNELLKTLEELGVMFGLSFQSISNIINNKVWRRKS